MNTFGSILRTQIRVCIASTIRNNLGLLIRRIERRILRKFYLKPLVQDLHISRYFLTPVMNRSSESRRRQ